MLFGEGWVDIKSFFFPGEMVFLWGKLISSQHLTSFWWGRQLQKWFGEKLRTKICW